MADHDVQNEKDESPERRAKVAALTRERRESRRVGFIVLGVLCVTMPTLWVVALIRRRAAENNGEVALAHSAQEEQGVIEYQNEIVFSPPNPGKPSRHDVAFSIGAILPEAKACMDGIYGTAFTSWRVNPDGSASDVRFETPPGALDMSRFWEATCLPDVIRRARVAPFEGEPIRVTYPFRNMASPAQMKSAANLLLGKGLFDGGTNGESAIVVTPEIATAISDSSQKQAQTRDH